MGRGEGKAPPAPAAAGEAGERAWLFFQNCPKISSWGKEMAWGAGLRGAGGLLGEGWGWGPRAQPSLLTFNHVFLVFWVIYLTPCPSANCKPGTNDPSPLSVSFPRWWEGGGWGGDGPTGTHAGSAKRGSPTPPWCQTSALSNPPSPVKVVKRWKISIFPSKLFQWLINLTINSSANYTIHSLEKIW